MKKYNHISNVIGVMGVIALSIPSFALGATQIVFSPLNTLSVEVGETATLQVYAVPEAGETVYTIKSSLSFPSEVMSISGFVFAPGWQPLLQTGYDQVDNENGALIKTGGYPGGISVRTLLGTVTLTGESIGGGVVSVANDSAAYDANSTNVIASAHPQGNLVLLGGGASEASVATAEVQPVATALEEASPAEAVVEDEGEAVTLQDEGEVEEDATQVAAVGQVESNLGAVGTVLTLGTGSLFGTLLLIIILAGLGYGGYYLYHTRPRG